MTQITKLKKFKHKLSTALRSLALSRTNNSFKLVPVFRRYFNKNRFI